RWLELEDGIRQGRRANISHRINRGFILHLAPVRYVHHQYTLGVVGLFAQGMCVFINPNSPSACAVARAAMVSSSAADDIAGHMFPIKRKSFIVKIDRVE